MKGTCSYTKWSMYLEDYRFKWQNQDNARADLAYIWRYIVKDLHLFNKHLLCSSGVSPPLIPILLLPPLHHHNKKKSLSSYSVPHGLPWRLSGKESTCSAGGMDLIPGTGRAPGEGNGNPLQYCCLDNPMDRGAWRAAVHGVTKSRAWLSYWGRIYCAIYYVKNYSNHAI